MQLHAHMGTAGLLLLLLASLLALLAFDFGLRGLRARRRHADTGPYLRQCRGRRGAARCEKWHAPSSKYQVAEAESGERRCVGLH